jgi:ligand-binding SRPBCC domain-containing protein
VKTWCLRSSVWVPEPPAVVFPFFAEAGNLDLLTPPWMSFEILTPQPIAMHTGTLIDYRIRVRGLPMRWRTRIADWQPERQFIDEQLRGPYTLWQHTHTFTPIDGGTLLGDEVRMRPRGGPLAGLLMSLFVRRDVERIFTYRRDQMLQRFRGRREDARVWWERAAPMPSPATAVSN